ncbi:hypothetical protein HanRHA438_Chr14g0630201 [Helianthus annuus]|nr:hypothetical protein HanRHA438_Chr14g0630201 [Helianthus annuus]
MVLMLLCTHPIFPPRDTDVAALEDWFTNKEIMIATLKQSLEKARNWIKQFANRKRNERSFQVGDFVYLKLQPYVQTSLRLLRYSKLSQRYYGPFLIIKKIGVAAYTLGY